MIKLIHINSRLKYLKATSFLFLYISIVINLFMINATNAVTEQEIAAKFKEEAVQNFKASTLRANHGFLKSIVEEYKYLISQIAEIDKCTFDYMDSELKTRECYQLTLIAKSNMENLTKRLASYQDNDLKLQSPTIQLMSQKDKIEEVLNFIGRNFKVLVIRNINDLHQQFYNSFSKDIRKMDCDIELIETTSLIGGKYNIALMRASMRGDYHQMKRVMAAVLGLKSKLEILIKKCNIDNDLPLVTNTLGRMKNQQNLFASAKLPFLLERACKIAVSKNPGNEVLRLCQQKDVSDHFFSVLNEFLQD